MTTAFASLTVPIDGSDQSGYTVDHAVTMAGLGTKLHFCSVVDAVGACYVGSIGALVDPLPMIEVLQEQATRFCRDAVAAAGRHGVTADGSVLFGSAVTEIDRFAEQTQSDGILMCTHARTGFARVIAGSLTESVLASSHVPVIVTHAGDDLLASGPITVAVDGSPASDAALLTAIAIAAEGVRSVSILHVVETERAWPEAAVILSAAADAARDAAIDFELVTLRGRACATIVESALRRGSPMIVLGTRGRSAFARTVLGSVAAGVVEHAHVPVTIVPHR
jgi:nucleotide-binding universal stress UspA family protein